MRYAITWDRTGVGWEKVSPIMMGLFPGGYVMPFSKLEKGAIHRRDREDAEEISNSFRNAGCRTEIKEISDEAAVAVDRGMYALVSMEAAIADLYGADSAGAECAEYASVKRHVLSARLKLESAVFRIIDSGKK